MALKQGRLGSLTDIIQYDDAVHVTAMDVDDPIRVNAAPVNAADVLRLADMPAGGTVITSTAVIADHAVVRGDGGGRIVQDSNISVDDVGNPTIGIGAAGVDYAITVDGENSDGTLVWMEDEEEWRVSGDDATNYLAIETDGTIEFNGTARIDWQKITANGITPGGGLVGGDITGAVADLQTAHDSNEVQVDEIAGNAGQNLEIDFTGVTAFNWVQILMRYKGQGGHSLTIQVEKTPFAGATWDTYDSVIDQPADQNYANHSFFIPADTDYINSGVVTIRIIHEMAGNAADEWHIDVVALYQ